MNKYIFLDFNGTVLNDVDICFELLNDILVKTNRPTITKERYLEVFGFPVRDYYIRAGVDLENYSYKDLADYFIEEYSRRNSKECSIYPEFYPFIEKARSLGFKIILCSASKRNLLITQLKEFGIYECFDDVLGLTNHFAASKVEIAKNYLKENNINPLDVTFIGDTTHDYEVGSLCGAKSILVSKGHQSVRVLQTVTNDIYPSLLEALEIIQ